MATDMGMPIATEKGTGTGIAVRVVELWDTLSKRKMVCGLSGLGRELLRDGLAAGDRRGRSTAVQTGAGEGDG
jgi:hypothetical protein